MSSFADQMEQDRDWISWVPGGDAEKYFTGDLVVGKVVDQSEQDGQYGLTKIMVLELEGENAGIRVGVWLNRTVLRNEVVKARPQWGERIGIKYLGEMTTKDGKTKFQSYRVKVDRPIENRPPVSWGEGDVTDSHMVPADPTDTVPASVQTAPPVAEPPVSGDDDIPF